MIALIDGDSMIHIIAYNFREVDPDDMSAKYEITKSVNSFMNMILTITKATHYMACISCAQEGKKSFRSDIYKYNIYKGDRPPKTEWMIKWEQTIRDIMETKWFFSSFPYLEADDMIAHVVWAIERVSDEECLECVICSPDKDMKQISGFHFDYKKTAPDGGNLPIEVISSAKANYNLWTQCLMGDKTDCIAGVPGLGIVKASKLLDEANDAVEYQMIAMQAYCKYFGPYYGPIIFRENLSAVRLLTPEHACFQQYGVEFAQSYQSFIHPIPGEPEAIFE